jgi:hypothetical protein
MVTAKEPSPMTLAALLVAIAQLIVGGVALGIMIHDRNRR